MKNVKNEEINNNTADTQEDEYYFVPAYMPDMLKLRGFLMEGKGDRTMGKYAEDCGSNAPKFSRIMKKNIVRPIDPELLKKIVEKAAKPLQLKEVMRAGGWDMERRQPVRDEMYERYTKGRYERINRELKIKSILTNELWGRGYMLQGVDCFPLDDGGEFPESKIGLRSFSLAPSLTLLIEKEGKRFWWHFIEDENELEGTYGISKKAKGYGTPGYLETMTLRFIIGDNATLFLKDLWEPETMKDRIRYTFVFLVRERYDIFKRALERAKIAVNNSFSLLLIDADHNRVEKEEFIPRIGGEIEKSIFDTPLKNTAPDEDVRRREWFSDRY